MIKYQSMLSKQHVITGNLLYIPLVWYGLSSFSLVALENYNARSYLYKTGQADQLDGWPAGCPTGCKGITLAGSRRPILFYIKLILTMLCVKKSGSIKLNPNMHLLFSIPLQKTSQSTAQKAQAPTSNIEKITQFSLFYFQKIMA